MTQICADAACGRMLFPELWNWWPVIRNAVSRSPTHYLRPSAWSAV